MSEPIHIVFQYHDCLNMCWSRMPMINILNRTEKGSLGFKSTRRTIGNCEKLGKRKLILLKEEHGNLLSTTKWSALKVCIKVALYGLNRLYLEKYMYIHIRYELLKKNRGICWRVCSYMGDLKGGKEWINEIRASKLLWSIHFTITWAIRYPKCVRNFWQMSHGEVISKISKNWKN